jgi:hypothetical protein
MLFDFHGAIYHRVTKKHGVSFFCFFLRGEGNRLCKKQHETIFFAPSVTAENTPSAVSYGGKKFLSADFHFFNFRICCTEAD